jgi:hypothetical protein
MEHKGFVTRGMMYAVLVSAYQCPKCKNIEIKDENQ